MHRGGLFIGGRRALGEPALWIVDCRWRNSVIKEKAWDFQDYRKPMKTIGRWMKACPQWNLVLLCPEGEDMRSLMRDLKTSDRTIQHGAWGFTPETSMQKWTITFDE